MLAFEVLKSGAVGIGGSTGAVLGRNLIALRDLIDRSLAEVRLEAGSSAARTSLSPSSWKRSSWRRRSKPRRRGLELTVTPVEPGLAIYVDRQLLAAALANLLQNAFKFSRPGGHVMLRTDTTTASGRVLIEVEDECGGLPSGRIEELFRPFEQRGADRTGLGLGLAIARESVETNGGEIRARSLPGKGCIFTVDLLLASAGSTTATGPIAAEASP